VSAARDALSHCVTVECATSADRAFAFLTDGGALGRWAFGCWGAAPRGEGLFVGRSLFDDQEIWVRIVDEPRLGIVDYHLGRSPDMLIPRISARVVPGPTVGRDRDHCLLSLMAWRPADMDDARWERLSANHEAEIHLIKALLQR